MKTISIELYKYDELSDEAKQKAREKMYDINVDYNWWDSIYEDAARIGLELNGFDIDRRSYCNGKFTTDAKTVAENIIKEHGPECETYKTAASCLVDFNGIDIEDDEADDQFAAQADHFLKSILEDYRIILQKEYEYLTSEEAIVEIIKANEYDFTIDGKLY